MNKDDRNKILIGVGVIIVLAVLVFTIVNNSNQTSIPCTNSQFGFCTNNPNMQLQKVCTTASDGTETCLTPN